MVELGKVEETGSRSGECGEPVEGGSGAASENPVQSRSVSFRQGARDMSWEERNAKKVVKLSKDGVWRTRIQPQVFSKDKRVFSCQKKH